MSQTLYSIPVPTVYLAGPIAGLGYDETMDWRKHAAIRLQPIKTLNPMRGKDYLKDEKEDVHNHVFQPGLETALSGPKGIVTRDRYDVQRCDLVLMNLLKADKVSIGTMVELGWADAYRKPVVVMIDENNPHIHPFVYEISGFIATNFEEAIEMVQKILL